MLPPRPTLPGDSTAPPPFLPLAFRFSASFGLMVLHLAIPGEGGHLLPGEGLYLSLLGFFFLEAVWEAVRSVAEGGHAFSTPSLPWIRLNLALDVALITVLIAFQGIDQERFSTIYIFPVLASAFYLPVGEILGVGLASVVAHAATVVGFVTGLLGPFGSSAGFSSAEIGWWSTIIGFGALQVFAATLVVILIRRNLEGLKETLRVSEATVDDLSALHRRVVESLFSGLITTDLEGQVTSANPAAEGILHRALPPGTPIQGIFSFDLQAQESLPADQRFETTYAAPTGTRRMLGGHVAPLRDAEGRQTGHLVLFQDLTEVKGLEERTRLSEQLATVGELSAGLAHEMRNPLASIMGCVQILQQGHPEGIMRDRAIGILGREAERMSRIMTNFLEFARPREVEVKPLFLPPLIEELKASWDTDPRTEGLPFRVGEVPDLWILADPLCAHQVLTNLLTNARKAVQQKGSGRVDLHGHVQGTAFQMVVADSGCGMDEDQLERLFVPFASGFAEGTGLGMSLVYQFVRQMGWEIRVESTVGLGTRVHLKVPVAP